MAALCCIVHQFCVRIVNTLPWALLVLSMVSQHALPPSACKVAHR